MPSNMIPEEQVQYIDIEAGLGRVRGNQALYTRMLNLFIKSDELAALEAALEVKDLSRGADLAHGIKGMAGNLGLDQVFKLSNELMVSLREGKWEEDLVAQYRQAVDLTIDAIGQAMSLLG